MARPQFGNRFLNDENDVFRHNAWDNVEWDDEQKELARTAVENNSGSPAAEIRTQLLKESDVMWDKFYGIHSNRFFKDRHWLFTEFPELKPATADDKVHILEVGCGVGNTVYPLLEHCPENSVYVYGCDFSSTAIEIVKSNKLYDESKCHAFVCDITINPLELSRIPKNSLDIITAIFVISALNPGTRPQTIKNLAEYLKPGGKLLFRDYGRYDLAQLRFKNGRCLSENFYARGDGTKVYFFTPDEVDKLMTDAGLQKVQNIVDKRLQVNRGKKLKMYRVWIQCKYQKPIP